MCESYPLFHIEKWIYPHILFDKVSKMSKNWQFLLKIAELSTGKRGFSAENTGNPQDFRFYTIVQ
jgi:hypothetical protein